MFSPIGPGVQSGRQDQHRRAGFEQRPVEHAGANGVMSQAFGARRDHQVDAMAQRLSFLRLFRGREDGGDPCVLRRIGEHPAGCRSGIDAFGVGWPADVDRD